MGRFDRFTASEGKMPSLPALSLSKGQPVRRRRYKVLRRDPEHTDDGFGQRLGSS